MLHSQSHPWIYVNGDARGVVSELNLAKAGDIHPSTDP